MCTKLWNLDIITKQWFSTSRRSWVNKVNNAWCSPEHIWAVSKDRKTSRGCISSRALLCSHGSGPHINADYRAVLFWCDSIVRSGWLNAVPSQHCSPEALKHFGDKHRLAVKRATEEKAYQMSSQWAISCIMRPGPQIRWRLKFDALLESSVPSAAVWSGSCAGCLMELSWWCVREPPSSALPSRNERLELRDGERREKREGGGVWL